MNPREIESGSESDNLILNSSESPAGAREDSLFESLTSAVERSVERVVASVENEANANCGEILGAGSESSSDQSDREPNLETLVSRTEAQSDAIAATNDSSPQPSATSGIEMMADNAEQNQAPVEEPTRAPLTRTTPRRKKRAQQTKRFQEFDVEKILGMKMTRRKGITSPRIFLVKWLGYPEKEASWLEEKELGNCVSKLKDFIRSRRDISPTYLVEKGGSAPQSDTVSVPRNINNWMTTEEVIKAVNRFKNMHNYKSNINIVEFKQLCSTDTIYIILNEGHFFVLLHLVSSNSFYIADGTNTYLKDEEARKRINEIVRAKIEVIECKAYNRADHCGSEAAMIALQFSRFHQLGKIDKLIDIKCSSIMESIKKTYHKEYSVSISQETVINEKGLKCTHCGKKFRKHAKKPLASHMRLCTSKRNIT